MGSEVNGWVFVLGPLQLPREALCRHGNATKQNEMALLIDSSANMETPKGRTGYTQRYFRDPVTALGLGEVSGEGSLGQPLNLTLNFLICMTCMTALVTFLWLWQNTARKAT